MSYEFPTSLRNLYEALFNKLRYHPIEEPTESEIAASFAPFIKTVNDNINNKMEITVGKYEAGELIPGIKYNSLTQAVSEAEENAHITVKQGDYHEPGNIEIPRSMRITFELGATIINDSVAGNGYIGYTTNKDLNVTIDGLGCFKKYGFIAKGAGQSGAGTLGTNQNPSATMNIECLDIETGGIQLIYWNNLKQINMKFRNATGVNQTNMFDSDNNSGVAVFDFNRIDCNGTLMDINVHHAADITWRNGYINHSNGDINIEYLGLDDGKITFENIRCKTDYTFFLGIASEPGHETILTLKDSLFETSEKNIFDIETSDIILVNERSYVNKPETGSGVFTGDSLAVESNLEVFQFGAKFS